MEGSAGYPGSVATVRVPPLWLQDLVASIFRNGIPGGGMTGGNPMSIVVVESAIRAAQRLDEVTRQASPNLIKRAWGVCTTSLRQLTRLRDMGSELVEGLRALEPLSIEQVNGLEVLFSTVRLSVRRQFHWPENIGALQRSCLTAMVVEQLEWIKEDDRYAVSAENYDALAAMISIHGLDVVIRAAVNLSVAANQPWGRADMLDQSRPLPTSWSGLVGAVGQLERLFDEDVLQLEKTQALIGSTLTEQEKIALELLYRVARLRLGVAGQWSDSASPLQRKNLSEWIALLVLLRLGATGPAVPPDILSDQSQSLVLMIRALGLPRQSTA
jgi:hypothetical protein